MFVVLHRKNELEEGLSQRWQFQRMRMVRWGLYASGRHTHRLGSSHCIFNRELSLSARPSGSLLVDQFSLSAPGNVHNYREMKRKGLARCWRKS